MSGKMLVIDGVRIREEDAKARGLIGERKVPKKAVAPEEVAPSEEAVAPEEANTAKKPQNKAKKPANK